MSRNTDELEGVTLLGNTKTVYASSYTPEVLETFVNKHPENDYMVTFDAYEFTSKCVTGDTLISVSISGKCVEVPIIDLVDSEGLVYGIDVDGNHALVTKKYYGVRKTGENLPVVTIKASSGNSVTCTPDHLILTNGYKWVRAEELKAGDMVLCGNEKKWAKVLSITDAGTADVYNMEVKDIPNYIANGIVIHNCPKTGQPDFAKVYIHYIPNERMVESKSLKLYLFSFRDHGDFHEDCMNIIMKDLIKLMDPKYIEVLGIFSPRGGISIFPFCNYAKEGSIYEEYKTRRLFDMSLKLTGLHYNQ